MNTILRSRIAAVACGIVVEIAFLLVCLFFGIRLDVSGHETSSQIIWVLWFFLAPFPGLAAYAAIRARQLSSNPLP